MSDILKDSEIKEATEIVRQCIEDLKKQLFLRFNFLSEVDILEIISEFIADV